MLLDASGFRVCVCVSFWWAALLCVFRCFEGGLVLGFAVVTDLELLCRFGVDYFLGGFAALRLGSAM